MLSVASVRSASGAANYFAKDDYYTVEGSSEISAWGGEGAGALGLSGEVGKDAFEGMLNGILPSGEGVAQVENRRAGDCQDFRVWPGIMGNKESHYVTTQRTCHTE